MHRYDILPIIRLADIKIHIIRTAMWTKEGLNKKIGSRCGNLDNAFNKGGGNQMH